MGTVRMVRKHLGVVPWLRALVFLAAALAAFAALPFYPPASRPLLALVCAALGAFAPAIGVLAMVILLAIPLAAGDFLIGIVFLLVGLAAVQFLGQDGARTFVVVALAFVASLLHAEWALAPLAGYILGATEGATAAFVAVALVELAGVVLGRGSVGALATGGTTALVDAKELTALAGKALTFSWLAPAIAKLDVDAVFKVLSHVENVPLLVAQPILWGAAAALSGSIAKRDAAVRTFAGITAASVALAAGSVAVARVFASPVPLATFGVTGIVSVLAAALVGAVAIWAFPFEEVRPEGTLPSLRTEDAEVDELLRMIANAEEALEDRHASDATVLITDMKSFARMTQEQGTLATAKTIQKHRDLLLPIIQRAGGHGKSTGGDGLVAAFPAPDDALKAAVGMQQALKQYNAKKGGPVHIRIGIAAGDVILDRTGCPFIGDALNVAARVMSLADGDQVFSASDVVEAAADLPSPVVPHGEYSLKNIARPVTVYEVLWDEGQQPKRPETEPSAA